MLASTTNVRLRLLYSREVTAHKYCPIEDTVAEILIKPLSINKIVINLSTTALANEDIVVKDGS